jgi:hypothetical protein
MARYVSLVLSNPELWPGFAASSTGHCPCLLMMKCSAAISNFCEQTPPAGRLLRLKQTDYDQPMPCLRWLRRPQRDLTNSSRSGLPERAHASCCVALCSFLLFVDGDYSRAGRLRTMIGGSDGTAEACRWDAMRWRQKRGNEERGCHLRTSLVLQPSRLRNGSMQRWVGWDC